MPDLEPGPVPPDDPPGDHTVYVYAANDRVVCYAPYLDLPVGVPIQAFRQELLETIFRHLSGNAVPKAELDRGSVFDQGVLAQTIPVGQLRAQYQVFLNDL